MQSGQQVKPEIKRFSGFRSKKGQFDLMKLRRGIEPYLPILQAAMQEPFFMDDCFKGAPLIEIAMEFLRDGEVFFCLVDGRLAAFAAIDNILHERHGYFHAWVHPDFRGKREVTHVIAKELITDYAFAPFGQFGLGLKKLKAVVTGYNEIGGRAALAIGFQHTGVSPCDALHDGVPCDTVLMELLNPDFFGPVQPESLNENSFSPESADVHASTGIPASDVHEPAAVSTAADEPDDDGPASVEPVGDHGVRRVSGEQAASVAPAQQQSNVQRPVRTVR